MAEAGLTGTYAVGVDATGHIAIVVGVDHAPNPLWGDMLVALDDRPSGLTKLIAQWPDAPPDAAPTQLEIHVGEPDQIPAALEWLRGAIEAVNASYERHVHYLAEVHRTALDTTTRWFGDTTPTSPPPDGRPGNPTLN